MRFETMPSSPILQAWAKTVGPSPSICSLNRMPGLALVTIDASVARQRPFAAWAEDGLSGSGGGRQLLSSAAEAAAARLIGTDGAEEVNLAKGRP